MQFEWNSKDRISFALYKEVIESKKAQFLTWFESNNKEVDLLDYRKGTAEYRISNFVIRENRDNNTITFCPNIVGCPAYFRIKSSESFYISITRKDGTAAEEIVFQAGETRLELTPANIRMYRVNAEGVISSGRENAHEVKREEPSTQEAVPDFFDGSFQGEQDCPPVSSDTFGVVNDPIDNAHIFVGGFNSDNAPDTAHGAGAVQRRSDTEQRPAGDASDDMQFFPDMFPTGEEGHGNSGSGRNEERKVREQSIEQDTVMGGDFSVSQQHTSADSSSRSSGSTSGYSVPYIETEGIRERREGVRELERDNDRMAQEIEKLEKQIAELESRSRQLSSSKSSLISHLEILQNEYDKDYSKFRTDIDEIKGRYTVDKSILEFYKDKDLIAIEDLLKQTDDLVNRVEEQIRLFVTAQQNKTDEIEKSLKVGKKE